MRLSIPLLLAAAISGYTQAKPIQIVEDGMLVGAKGVDVGGTLYDVQFIKAGYSSLDFWLNCGSLYDGCDSQSDFAFQNQADADVASVALATVFYDSPEGAFGTDYRLIEGCSYRGQPLAGTCELYTPFDVELVPEEELAPEVAYITISGAYQWTQCPDDEPCRGNSTAPVGPWVYAYGPQTEGVAAWVGWTEASKIPSPGTLGLVALGLAGLCLRRASNA